MTKIIAVSGKKQSGKSTLCSYIQTVLAVDKELHFCWSSDRFIKYQKSIESGNRIPIEVLQDDIGKIVCKCDSQEWIPDPETVGDSATIYNFADALKNLCTDVLGLSKEQVWGTDVDKNSLTAFLWDKMPDQMRRDPHNDKLRTGPMSARQVLQIVGTEVMRRMFDDDIWVNCTLRKIKSEAKKLAIIADLRFKTEFNRIIDEGGYVIRLERNIFQDSHASEIDLDGFEFSKYPRTLVIPATANIMEKNRIAMNWIGNTVLAD